MNQIVEVSEQQLAMMRKAGILPNRVINPYENLFETLIQDALNFQKGNFDADTIDEMQLKSREVAKKLFDKVFDSTTKEYEAILDATIAIYEEVENVVQQELELEMEYLETM